MAVLISDGHRSSQVNHRLVPGRVQKMLVSPRSWFHVSCLCGCTEEGLVKNIQIQDNMNCALCNIKLPRPILQSKESLSIDLINCPPRAQAWRSVKPQCSLCAVFVLNRYLTSGVL